MRVLLVNPGYPDTFWSFKKVVRIFGKKALLPPLGLITVAALLPQHWQCRLADLATRDLTEDDWQFAELVVVSGMQVQQNGILSTIAKAAKRGKKVIVGGPWAFHCADKAIAAGATIAVRGEGEVTIDLVLAALERGDSGLIVESLEKPDITKSPTPRYDLLHLPSYMDMAVQFSRGCPFHCEFCDVTLLFGRNVRTKTPSQVLNELQTLYDLGWRRNLFFADDNIVGNPLRSKELLRDLIVWMEERNYPFDFYTQASVTLGSDRELMDLLVRAGFFAVFLGIETTDLDSLKLSRKFQNAAADLDNVCRKVNKAGLQIMAGCMMGFDNENPGADQRLIDFAERNSIPELLVNLLQAAPGTDLWIRLEREGRLLGAGIGDNFLSQSGRVNYTPTRPIAQIAEEFSNVNRHLYQPALFLKRAYTHLAAMDEPPFKKGFFMPYVSEIRGIAIILFSQGVLSPSRRQLWKFLLASLWHFPKRIRFALMYCLRAQHYQDYVNTVQADMKAISGSHQVDTGTCVRSGAGDSGTRFSPGLNMGPGALERSCGCCSPTGNQGIPPQS